MSPGAPQPRPSRFAALSQFTSRQPKPLVATVGFVSIGLMGLIDYWLTPNGTILLSGIRAAGLTIIEQRQSLE